MPARRSRPRARWVLAAALVCVVLVVAVILLTSSKPTTGYDASYPQCHGSLPSEPLFGIVGVDGGLASNANPCLGPELQWARNSPGQKHPPQTRISFYINTGNPGADHVATWPKSGKAPAYGSCNGLLTDACSYLYGEQRAAVSYRLVAQHDELAARTAPWWLDVELMSSWAGTYKLNLAALKGFVAGLTNSGATGLIGVYSTAAQWKEITGLTAQTTAPAFNRRLLDWIAGIGTFEQARASCASGGFTGVLPSLAQYSQDHFDADLRCPVTG